MRLECASGMTGIETMYDSNEKWFYVAPVQCSIWAYDRARVSFGVLHHHDRCEPSGSHISAALTVQALCLLVIRFSSHHQSRRGLHIVAVPLLVKLHPLLFQPSPSTPLQSYSRKHSSVHSTQGHTTSWHPPTLSASQAGHLSNRRSLDAPFGALSTKS